MDGLLESALVGKDKKTRLAATATLLAAADALAEVRKAQQQLWTTEDGLKDPLVS